MALRHPPPRGDKVGLAPENVEYLEDVAACHVKSFDFAVGEGLNAVVAEAVPVEVRIPRSLEEFLLQMKRTTAGGTTENGHATTSSPAKNEGDVLRFWFSNPRVESPAIYSERDGTSSAFYPREARERGMNYGGRFTIDFHRQWNDEIEIVTKNVAFGDLPIMVGSSRCTLSRLDPLERVTRGEDASEAGGYFIVSGYEKIARMLQLTKRNYPVAIERKTFAGFGVNFTNKGVLMRCVDHNETSITNTLHYLSDGTCKLRIRIRKSEYFIPLGLLLKALKSTARVGVDREIYDAVSRGLPSDSFEASRIEMELRYTATQSQWSSAASSIQFLGSQFRNLLQVELPAVDMSDTQVGQYLLDNYILIHLTRRHAGGGGDDRRTALASASSSSRGNEDKFHALVELTRKLYSFAEGKATSDDPDALAHHEILLSGHIFLKILKELLELTLLSIRTQIRRELAKRAEDGDAGKFAKHILRLANDVDAKYLTSLLARAGDPSRKLFSFLSTGTLVSPTGLDLAQTTGFVIHAEKLNRLRYLAHFAAVHRGQFFAEMKTLAGRKLMPESWGFLCPVHTPDGAPCGVLNHLTQLATPLPSGHAPREARDAFIGCLTLHLASWGMISTKSGVVPPADCLPVFLDGCVLGHIPEELVERVARNARRMKIANLAKLMRSHFGWFDPARGDEYFPTARVVARVALETCILDGAHAVDETNPFPPTLEIVLAPRVRFRSDAPAARSAWPGLFLFAGSSRLVRPVIHLETGAVDLISPLEQVFLNIAVRREELLDHAQENRFTHVELSPAVAIHSLAAALTPFPDFNQSPRNIYQVQMGKQTMGTPSHNHPHNVDVKAFRLVTPQAPLVATEAQDAYGMGDYPSGTNAVVAVISYTGYDMDDAMIVNKSAMERGFAHGHVFKSVRIETSSPTEVLQNRPPPPLPSSSARVRGRGNPEEEPEEGEEEVLDADGLPQVGAVLRRDFPIARWADTAVTGKFRTERYKDEEECRVERVRVYPSTGATGSSGRRGGGTLSSRGGESARARRACVTLRYVRNPVVGDKFSSRHGQKGVLSVLWPQSDMPFTESGMCPDVIINPHAFPSRMTIGMLVESMAGKSAAVHGVSRADATPFRARPNVSNEDHDRELASDYFGKQLVAAGYSYHGSEPLYSGVLGTVLRADIYVGVVYYQRLRHMVSDKAQVRSLGPVDNVTRQPVKGRKRHGGVRFGEMERDSLVSHGAAFLVQDRLLNCSDRHTARVCCGTILGFASPPSDLANPAADLAERKRLACRVCGSPDAWSLVTIPYALRYLVNELAAMGISLKFEV